jgi:PAS domain S-box-containing protein
MKNLHTFVSAHSIEIKFRVLDHLLSHFPKNVHEDIRNDYQKLIGSLVEHLLHDLEDIKPGRDERHPFTLYCKKLLRKRSTLKLNYQLMLRLLTIIRDEIINTLPVEIISDRRQLTRLNIVLDTTIISLNEWWEYERQKQHLDDMVVVEELKIVKNDLQQQLNTIYQILKESPIGIAGCDDTFNVQIWNSMATKLTGFQQADILKKSFLDLLNIESRQQFLEKVNSDKRLIYRFRLQIKSREGAEFRAIISLSRIKFMPNNRVTHVISFMDLKNDQTIRSQYRKINQLSGIARLASAIMHDIRNPINSLGLNLEVLEQLLEPAQSANPLIEEILQKVYRQIGQLSQSLNQYLQYSRLIELSLEPMEVTTQLANLITELRHEYVGKNIVFKYRKPEMEQWVSGDWFQLRRALVNIIQNATEILGADGLIKLAASRRNGKLLIRITDNGPGIEPERLKKIFEPFYSTKKTGTGLGLFIVREIIHSHHGRIYCTSKPGAGTKFTISLPVISKPDPLK